MKKHVRNLRYILRHKYFVLRAGLRLGVPLWRLVIHDWSKFLPCEWVPYANRFFMHAVGPRKMHEPGAHPVFDLAWLHHLHLNRHHFQWWITIGTDRIPRPLRMPETYIREMIADWVGASRAQGTSGSVASVQNWYDGNADRMLLHPETKWRVEALLRQGAWVY